MDELLAEFIAETRETLEAIAGEIVEWEAHPDDKQRLDAIFRFVHTVKGSCGFLDLPRLEKLSHAAEGALAAVRAGKRPADATLVNAMLATIDRVTALVGDLEAGRSIDGDDGDLIDAFDVMPEAEQPVSATGSEANAVQSGALHSSPARSIRVPVELLDRLMGGVSDLVLARNELSRQLRQAAGNHTLDFAFDRMSACVAEMRDAITWTRMQRIESLFAALPRLVRDLQTDLGKSVALEIEGGDVELDREMIEMLRDPLTHIVRNAIDHGIEDRADRAQNGKPATGRLDVSARQSGNQIHITIRDDGRGIDTRKLIEKAVASGKIDDPDAIERGSNEAFELIFKPGLSTAEEVSEVSGRGVGMDVVRANIERIGGTIDIESEAGAGTAITLSVPLTLTIIPALIIGSAGRQFAIPRSAIDEIVAIGKGPARIETVGGSELAMVRDARLPVVRLVGLFGGEETCRKLIIVRPGRGQRFALLVADVFDHEELVAKPAAPGIMQAGVYAGTALPDDGRPLLLLDIAGIADRAGLSLKSSRFETPAAPVAVADTARALIFDDLDGKRRAVRMGVVDRIVQVDPDQISEHAGSLRVVLGDELIPVAARGALDSSGPIRLLRMSDGEISVAYAIASATDVITLPSQIEPPAGSGAVTGVALIEGEPVEIVDAFHILAEYGLGRAHIGDKPVCRIAGGDSRWATEVLAPLVEEAGYDVRVGDQGDAELVILTDDDEGGLPDEEDGAVLRLTSDAHAPDGRIYRYDRAGIYFALRENARRAGTAR